MSRNLSYPKLCALCGTNPSRLSQAMHNAGFAALNLPYTYVAFDTADTIAAVEAMRALGIVGLSLTIPHKEKAVRLVDTLQEQAKSIGAINTIVNDGKTLNGYNTDFEGVTAAFREAGIESCRHRRTLIIGAGGAARATIVSLLEMGATDICIYNKTLERARSLEEEFPVRALDTAAMERLKRDVDFEVICNTTPLGSRLCQVEAIDYPLNISSLGREQIVFDAVTNQTPLTEGSRLAGAHVIYGSRMLLHQALRQFELFTGVAAPIKQMEDALLIELGKQG